MVGGSIAGSEEVFSSCSFKDVDFLHMTNADFLRCEFLRCKLGERAANSFIECKFYSMITPKEAE